MGRSRKKILVLVCFCISIIVLVAAAMPAAANDDAGVKEAPEGGVHYGVPKGPLSVPVFPRGTNSEAHLPEGADLRDSYIVLEDGSVMSVADWIVGSLNKDKSGIAMTDYESRLFLGQVARASVGMDENLVNRSLVHVRPTLSYKSAPAPKGIEAIALSLARLVVNTILPGTPEGYDPSKAGGAFSPLMITGGGATVLFQEQFVEALHINSGDIKESGVMQVMLKEQQKKLEKNISRKLKPKRRETGFSFTSGDEDRRE